MHTCPPPADDIEGWLTAYPSIKGNYGHLLLEQGEDRDPNLADALVPYFESAHGDAREYFCAQIGIDLHPDADDDNEDDEAQWLYPKCLPTSARRGLFGEVMAGMLTEHYSYIGKHNWKIPVFLFRYHADVEKYLFDLARDAERERQVFGRFGSDFLGLCLDDDGNIIRLIVGEAKWRDSLNAATIDSLLLGKWIKNKETGNRARSGKGIWFEINRDISAPHGLRQLQRLLQERDPNGYGAAILSIDKVLALRNPAPMPRTNLILIAGNDVQSRGERTSLIPWEETPEEYTAPHDLQVVELILNDGGVLIDQIYDSLWFQD
ncbi:aminotransferase [Aeromonas veronii]|uniref:aminotransferase n=1 Tax=Aeromonas veronii TaxID=654 RepID=UPI00142F893A|nr:aminotransferase [Aeromonas veronii]NJI24190.1 aminotransferase [Aeromonas veronii]NJI36101.1 aminotransferase [Aeromonas veronii]